MKTETTGTDRKDFPQDGSDLLSEEVSEEVKAKAAKPTYRDEDNAVTQELKKDIDPDRDTENLPEDFPGRLELAAAGITSYTQLKAVEAGTVIPGIDVPTATEIARAMKAKADGVPYVPEEAERPSGITAKTGDDDLLPDGFPGKLALAAYRVPVFPKGITTFTQLASVGDTTDIPGIGAATAKSIAEARKAHSSK
jgi:hypothetical protein